MASPTSGRLVITPSSRILHSPLTDETIWKRLREAGLDEESIKRRDKAALIAYIAKLEAEIFDHQHHMGLLILERKELASKYEQINAAAEAAEILHKRDQAAHLSAMAEAKKREESLKKALGVEKECLASIEKALHEMRAESAEIKVAAECKLAEARIMIEDAQRKFVEAEAKLRAAESLEAEASRFHRSAERKLKEVETREDDLSKRIVSFKSEYVFSILFVCDEKEKEIILERQSLSERKKILQQEHERLLDAQTSLNQREDHIFSRSLEISRLEKELEASRASFEEKLLALKEEKSNVELSRLSLSKREEAIIEREALLNKKEQELHFAKEKLASKESDEIQKAVANHDSILRVKKLEFEAELERRSKLVEDEIETKRRAWELREMDLNQREDVLLEREHDLEVQSRALADKEKDVIERSNLLDEKEKSLISSAKEVELKKSLLEKEKEDVKEMKLDLQKFSASLDAKQKQVFRAEEKLEAMKSETDELSILEMKLKEELDMVRAQKLELMAEVDKLQAEKTKFEAEWEFMDEKREELRKEAEHVAVEREAISVFLKDERDSLRQERNAMRDQHKRDVESLNHEREEFMNKMVHEHSEWFNKIQRERADFLLGIEMQKRELEDCIEKRREELESSFREKEKTFDEEKKKELEHISCLREKAEKELEQVTLEMKRLDAERMEINLDRQRRDKEWAELNNSIEELKVQRQKLEKQRELLHADREEIQTEIEHLNKLEDLKIAVDYMAVSEMQHSRLEHTQQKISARRYSKPQSPVSHVDLVSQNNLHVTDNGNGFNSPPVQKENGSSHPSSARFSWIKKCTDLLFKYSPEKPSSKDEDKSVTSDHEDASLATSSKRQSVRFAFGEPKVILEVPSEDKDGKGTHDSESEIKKDAAEKCLQSISEDELQGGRKRRADNYVSSEFVDPSELQRQKKKKRRQQQDVPANPSEEATTHDVISKESSVREDQHVVISSNHNQGGSEETSVLVIDKIIRISEVTCEKIDDQDIINQENIVHLENPVAGPELDALNAGGKNVFSDSTQVETGNVKQVTETSQVTTNVLRSYLSCVPGLGSYVLEVRFQKDDVSGKSDQKLNEHDLGQSDNSKEDEQIAKRTRSKMKK
ncbi:hypothetical protein Pint_27829 [Pistacia integerrima]|uniref:Uncharacterized protein n=1 Tax=Pistacia integerrima TaxID=434235 RepID=A0ACC0YMJ8_9ROSI|nr:hypothetical protein Pint_27829 [Pistacia integerrima]